jgi:hypothetical protein
MSQLTEELDVAIANLEFEDQEERASRVIRNIEGVEAARLIPGGIWMRYRPDDTDEKEIVETLVHQGFEVTLFQDSASGKIGHVVY